jgi:hypothetical protein
MLPSMSISQNTQDRAAISQSPGIQTYSTINIPSTPAVELKDAWRKQYAKLDCSQTINLNIHQSSSFVIEMHFCAMFYPWLAYIYYHTATIETWRD